MWLMPTCSGAPFLVPDVLMPTQVTPIVCHHVTDTSTQAYDWFQHVLYHVPYAHINCWRLLLCLQMDTQLVGASWGPAPAPVSGMLVPTLLTLLTSQSPDIRRRCLAILNEMFGQMPSGFHAALPQYSDVSWLGLWLLDAARFPAHAQSCVTLMQAGQGWVCWLQQKYLRCLRHASCCCVVEHALGSADCQVAVPQRQLDSIFAVHRVRLAASVQKDWLCPHRFCCLHESPL